MKTYMSVAVVFAATLGMTSVAMAHGGGGGMRGGGSGAHFGGGGMHSSTPGVGSGFRGGESHRSDSRDAVGRGDHHREGYRGFWGGGWPYYYDHLGSGGLDYSAMSVNSGDSLVEQVQKALSRQGYYRAAIDGDLDLLTQDAIEGYERDHRLPVTRTIDDVLLNSLHLQ
jgi:hypothetical protein